MFEPRHGHGKSSQGYVLVLFDAEPVHDQSVTVSVSETRSMECSHDLLEVRGTALESQRAHQVKMRLTME
jgi:hypothetical protein